MATIVPVPPELSATTPKVVKKRKPRWTAAQRKARALRREQEAQLQQQTGTIEEVVEDDLVGAFQSLSVGAPPPVPPPPPSTAIPPLPSAPSAGQSDHGSDSDEEDDTRTPLEAFFGRFPGFNYQPSKSATSEFKRLWKKHLRLDPKDQDDSREKDDLYMDWSRAMTAQFGVKFGADVHDLQAWKRLCERIEIPAPDVLEEAREAVFNAHVNLVDLVDNGKVVKFDTELQLSRYSRRRNKMFPSGSLGGNDILTALLRFIHFPPPENSRRTSGGYLVRNY